LIYIYVIALRDAFIQYITSLGWYSEWNGTSLLGWRRSSKT